MSEHGLRSGLDELRHRFMMQCVAAPLPEWCSMIKCCISSSLLIWRRDILWVSKVKLHHRFQMELFSFSTMTWNIFWAGSAGSVVSCQIYCFRYLFDRDLLLIMVRGSVRDSSAPQQRSWSRRSYG
jgi:hypothetical protein